MLYEFSCAEHGNFDVWQDINDVHVARCPSCGKRASRKYSLGGHFVDFRPGFDWGLGEYVDTKRQRENIVAESGLKRIK